jgi:hypothetical protein
VLVFAVGIACACGRVVCVGVVVEADLLVAVVVGVVVAAGVVFVVIGASAGGAWLLVFGVVDVS